MLSAKQIPPGQSGQIEAAVKTEGVSGKIEKTVTVTSNDPRQPQVVLNLVAIVEPEFNLSERMIYFGSAPQGKPVVKEVEIRIPSERSVKVLSAESTDAAVTVFPSARLCVSTLFRDAAPKFGSILAAFPYDRLASSNLPWSSY